MVISPTGARCAASDCPGTPVHEGRCPEHLSEEQINHWLADMAPGEYVDLSNCRVPAELFDRIAYAVCNAEGQPSFGHFRFAHGTVVGGTAYFSEADFTGPVDFTGSSFPAGLDLSQCTFHTDVSLSATTVNGALDLSRTTFRSPVRLGICARSVDLSGARFEEKSTVALRYADVDLTDAVFLQPVAVAARPSPFPGADESGFAGVDPGVRIRSLRGVDASLLSLAHTDLTHCRFAGSFHLDQLHLEGRWTLGTAPPGWRTRRLVVAEERAWRAWPERRARARAGWGEPSQVEPPGLATLTTVYRQLRKAREDAKDEPGAADLYYGEMEMRRHGHGHRRAERWLLDAYWLLSGYGLRASRALGWLAAAMLTTVVLLMGFGLPDDTPRQEVRQVTADDGKPITVLDKPEPELTKPYGERFTGERFDKALTVTLNSVVFRTSGQDLTTAGGYVEMVSRFTEPVLVGLAVLAVRGRVKRGS